MSADQLTVIVPVFNEEAGLHRFAAELKAVLEHIDRIEWTVLFVDDGSKDETRDIIHVLNAGDPRFRGLALSRNFGKEVAIAAGLRNAGGDAIILMDGDLEHPPAVLPSFVENWRAGYKIVFGRRTDSEQQSALRRLYSKAFHRVFTAIAKPSIPSGAVDFLLMDRKAVDAMNALGERARFSKGLYAWIGFKSTVVPFDVGRREAGDSKFGFVSLARFAIDGLVSFSTIPLKVWSYLGLVISVFALLYGLAFIIDTIVNGPDVPGFPTLVVSIMFFAGVQLISLGVLGEYVARIYEEVKGRPLFIVDETIGGGSPRPASPETRIASAEQRD
ncbi:glycosyltransferase family 2 protein [Kaistia dalseonensis]|uniref:Glycosyltransferase involved in cell wall biosynthesis n=1 Tax=Kaistia dalseonensis TaxID=410840 RepID=A0ABU0HCF6_9HYPH|nr:glycosyltransferase family 2 protein [Kaistia dalseonensis]MCX5497021.1 glycosyltransferase family 2 protein [Kaistia dalseonensis]MDQ0439647.1 glycosyltransferase involved in cell wall biosynthesis [Kaistia dalseonensis]